MTVSRQLQAVRDELTDAGQRIAGLAARVTDAEWVTRPRGGGWSAAECVVHLTMTNEAYLPLLDAARAAAPAGAPLPRRYRMGLGGWLLARMLEPPARMRTRTIPAFIPGAAASRGDTMAQFTRSHDALLAWIDSAGRMALDRIVIASPFNARLRYNAYAALRVLAAHERRHAWQAERAARGIP